jgi:signal transduction histidine kinase
VKRIGDLVSGFRQLSRPGRPGPRERIDVNQLVRDCLASLASDANERPPVLTLSSEPCEALVCADDLRTSLLSLLAYLRGPGRPPATNGDVLRVGSELVEGRACVIVHDPLLRLSADERRRLFDPRVEIDTSAGRTMRLNLALPLAYQLLRRNGAEITLSGEHDRGFAFRVVLPPAVSPSELSGGF